MAEGQWVNIPGKGRRWQQPSGTLMMTKPGFGQGEFFQTRASQLLGGASNLLGSMGLGLPGGPQAAGPLGPRGVFGQPPLTGREKMAKAWTSEGMVYSDEAGGGDFGFRTGNGKPYSQPSYKDAQGNIYDAVSGRLLYPAKSKPSPITSPTGAPPSPSGSPAAERAYQSEASRIAQLTAQDPELQRYEAARKIAAGQGATPEQVQSAEDLGMQLWAQKYGKTLAPKVKPGQAGYDVIQKTLYPGGAPLPALPAESIAMLDEIAPANDMGIRPDITPMPGALPVFSDASDAMYQAVMGGPSTLVPPAPQLPSPSAASPQQTGGISFQDASFETPATKRRSDLFAQLLSGIRQYGGTP